MREYHYQVDRDGGMFHAGTQLLDPLVLRFFLRAMRRTPDGRYLVLCQGEHNWFEAYDTPFVVQRLRLLGDGDRVTAVDLYFVGDYHERLDPTTLETERGYLFCQVRQGAFRARFGRVAMQQIAPLLVDDGAGPHLSLGGVGYLIRDLTPVTS
jgi:hypothetical protein